MGEIVTHTSDPNNPVRLSEKALARIDKLAEQGGEEYYEDIPKMSEEFLATAKRVDFPPKEPVTVELTPRAAAYVRSRGLEFRLQLGAVLEAHIAEAEGRERRMQTPQMGLERNFW